MENKHKKFNAYDKVLVRDCKDKWQIDFYSHRNDEYMQHITMIYGVWLEDSEILTYEGNEHLVGTTDEPEEEITIENGEYCFGADKADCTKLVNWRLFQFDCVDSEDSLFKERFGEGRYFDLAFRVSDFNPDMDELRKDILCVKNGKIVKYHGKN